MSIFLAQLTYVTVNKRSGSNLHPIIHYFHLGEVHVSLNTSFNNLVYLIQSNLFPSTEYLVSRITLYRDGCSNSNVITIVEDKDVLWLFSLISIPLLILFLLLTLSHLVHQVFLFQGPYQELPIAHLMSLI